MSIICIFDQCQFYYIIAKTFFYTFLKEELQFKREELKVRLKEASNKEKELELAKEKLLVESAVKTGELQLLKERQAAEINERSLLTSALLKFIGK
jgi:hypothetical protein